MDADGWRRRKRKPDPDEKPAQAQAAVLDAHVGEKKKSGKIFKRKEPPARAGGAGSSAGSAAGAGSGSGSGSGSGFGSSSGSASVGSNASAGGAGSAAESAPSAKRVKASDERDLKQTQTCSDCEKCLVSIQFNVMFSHFNLSCAQTGRELTRFWPGSSRAPLCNTATRTRTFQALMLSSRCTMTPTTTTCA